MKEYKLWSSFSIDERVVLLKKAKKGDNKSITIIWKSLEGIIKMQVNNWRYNSGSLVFEDLFQEAFLPFLVSIKKYNLDNYKTKPKGADFITFSTMTIRRSFRKTISNKGSLIRIPLHLNEKNHKINRALSILGLEGVDDDNIFMISKEANLTENEITQTLIMYKSIPFIQNEKSLQGTTVIIESDSEHLSDLIKKLINGLTLAEYGIMREYIGIGVKQLTKRLIMEKHNIKRRTFDNLINKSSVIINK